MPNRKPWMTALLSGACSLLILTPQLDAQQRRATEVPRQERAAAAETLRLPPEGPIVIVTVQSPTEVRVGQSFDYQIRVQNSSQNIAVHDLVIAQHAAEGFEIESSEVIGKPGSEKGQQSSTEQKARAQQREQRAEDPSQDKPKDSADKESTDKQKDDKQPREQRRKQDDQQGKAERRESDRDEAKSDDAQRDQASDKAESQAAESKRTKSDDSQKDESENDDSARDDSASDAAQTDKSQADREAGDQTRRDGSRRAERQRGRSSQQSGQSDGSRWKIDRLMPGESQTIRVTAASDAEGTGSVCVAVESYVPAVCLATRFTKPELDIEKKAPETANICDEIQFEYLVKNTGTGDLQRFTVRDDLPEGLKTIDGAKKLEFTLEDGLKAGGTRKFVARLRASDTGEFTSRAVVEGSGGLEARSNRAGTRVQKADLAVAIDGPQAQQVGALANYTVRVTNRGDAPAPGTQLRVYFPRSADLVRAGQPRKSSREVTPRSSDASRSDEEQAAHDHRPQDQAGQAEDRDDAQAQAVAAKADAAKSDDREDQDQPDDQDKNSQQKANEDDGDDDDRAQATKDQAPQPRARRAEARREQSRENQQRQQMAQNHWQLGTLAPGETVEVTYVLRPYEGGELEQAAVAEYVCATAQDREILQSEVATTTEILMLTGLRVTVLDDHDPVAVGQNVIYTITVLNQGNASAHDVEISAKLPEELKYVESKGASTGEASENQIDFKPVEVLEPGQKAVWQIVASVKEGVGEKTQSSIEVELSSDELDETITSQEPTTLFEAEKRTAKASDEEESEKK